MRLSDASCLSLYLFLCLRRSLSLSAGCKGVTQALSPHTCLIIDSLHLSPLKKTRVPLAKCSCQWTHARQSHHESRCGNYGYVAASGHASVHQLQNIVSLRRTAACSSREICGGRLHGQPRDNSSYAKRHCLSRSLRWYES